MTWSKIQHTELSLEAYIRMNDNQMNGCEYHNNRHVESMYEYLEKANEPYDEALDWAVMFHDVVYDNQPEKELRSAQFFIEQLGKFPRGCNLDSDGVTRVCDLILATINHKVISEEVLLGNSAIIRADLHALTDDMKTLENFLLIAKESIALYNIDLNTFALTNEMFMRGLLEQLGINRKTDPIHDTFYDRVMDGIVLTHSLARTLRGL
jgi:CRISPR/Cas system-associated endonuclease Cas3-HD